MKELIDKLVEFATGERAKLFWCIMIIAVIIAMLLFPYIDANFLAYSRINKRINNMDRLLQLDTEKINSNALLKKEYNSIIEEINRSSEKSVGTIVARQDTKEDRMIKFMSGGLIFWLIGLFALLYKDIGYGNTKIKKFVSRIVIVTVFGGLGVGSAYLGIFFPTIINVWVNGIVVPILWLLLLISLAHKVKQ